MKNSRKGFTIVELVIVIAVIAILAAVLIPTFSSLIQKANLSADQVAVKNMNTVLATAEIEEDDFGKLINTLAENGFNSKKALIPTTKDHVFYWYSTYNTIVLVNEKDEVVFPKDDKIIAAYATDKGTDVIYDLGKSVAASSDDLKSAIAAGGDIYLMGDVKLDGFLSITTPGTTNINLNGHKIIRENGTGIYVNNADAVVNIDGDGEVSCSANSLFVARGTVNVYGGTFTSVTEAAYSTGGIINIYGGKFTSTSEKAEDNKSTSYAPVNVKDDARDTGVINIYGGEFYNYHGEYDLSGQIALGEVVDKRDN